MKIGFFSEAGYQGGVPRNHPNMRTDVAWVCALGAEHVPLPLVREVKKDTFDVGIVIIPKNKMVVQQFNMMEELKRVCKKVCIMQESTYSYWQDDEISTQVWYYNCLLQADLIFCHNDVDLKYYRGLTQKRCELLQSVMITDNLDGNDSVPSCGGGNKDGVIIGGNFVSAYRGFDSYIVGKQVGLPIYAPTTGRMKPEERQLDITHLDWMQWYQWIHVLSKFYIGVQLGTPSAGTFNLNLSFHGIPCIGYDQVNPQKDLHPQTTIEEGDLNKGIELAIRLKEDVAFYEQCSRETRRLFEQKYSEKVFVEKTMKILESL